MNQDQLEIPIQPVERPILCSPYEEPNAHWVYDTETLLGPGDFIEQNREVYYKTTHIQASGQNGDCEP